MQHRSTGKEGEGAEEDAAAAAADVAAVGRGGARGLRREGELRDRRGRTTHRRSAVQRRAPATGEGVETTDGLADGRNSLETRSSRRVRPSVPKLKCAFLLSLQVTEIFENPVNAQCLREEICVDPCGGQEAAAAAAECANAPFKVVCDDKKCGGGGKQVQLINEGSLVIGDMTDGNTCRNQL